jgi:hypothetical protein
MALEPEAALYFVSTFVDISNASGVMGSKISIFDPQAGSFA